VGLCRVLALPSPKFHDHDVTIPVLVFAKDTLRGAVPELGDARNDTTGAGVEDVGVGLGVGAIVPTGASNRTSLDRGLSTLSAS
jgi:hypothetical protein